MFGQAPKSRLLQIVGGRTTVGFYSQVLDSSKLRVEYNETANGDLDRAEPTHGFQIDFSKLNFTLTDGRMEGFKGGTASHRGGFRIVCGSRAIDADQFQLAPNVRTNDGLQLVVEAGKEAYAAFEFEQTSATYSFEKKTLTIGNLDLALSARAAQELGRPDLAGRVIGFLKVFASVEPIDGRGDIEAPSGNGPPPKSAGLDLSLSNMNGITWIGRTGTYPNGNNALTLSTTSCNVGTIQIPWNAPMATTHPGIVMNLYRLKDGRFEQVGWSWVKHGFLSTNSNGCGTCQNPGTGTLLGINCSDTYGGGNNDDQFYLGGREEWNALTGAWTCQNSWFSNYINDCQRRNTGTGLSVTDHRFQARDADLGNTGAQYFYEARYITAGNDINIYNNIGSRTCTMTWNGSSWNFTTTDTSQLTGPAITRWGDLRTFAQPQSEGDVTVAVQTTDLGNGMFHYEYALYNSSSDRQVREFSVPLPSGVNVQNIGFHDVDGNAANDWVGTYANGKVTWSTGVYGSSSANPLAWSFVYNFRFDANVPPGNGSATLGLFKPGAVTTMSAQTKAPLVLAPVTSFTALNGVVVAGNVQSLAASDGDRLRIAATNTGARAPTGMVASITAPSGTINGFTLGAVTRAVFNGTAPTQTIDLYNWATSSWEQVDSRPATLADQLTVVSITSNPTRFIADNGQIHVRIRRSIASGPTLGPQEIQYDQVGFQFN